MHALPTSTHSARVGRGAYVMDSSICVAQMAGLPALRVAQARTTPSGSERNGGGQRRGGLAARQVERSLRRARITARITAPSAAGVASGAAHRLHFAISCFWIRKTRSSGTSMPRSPLRTGKRDRGVWLGMSLCRKRPGKAAAVCPTGGFRAGASHQRPRLPVPQLRRRAPAICAPAAAPSLRALAWRPLTWPP